MEFATFADRAGTIDDEAADLEIVAHVRDLLADAGDDTDERAEPQTLELVARFAQEVQQAQDLTTARRANPSALRCTARTVNPHKQRTSPWRIRHGQPA